MSRIFLISSMLVVSGLFAENENACRKDYVFCPDCSITAATATTTPDATQDGTVTLTPTVKGTQTISGSETPEPTETPEPSGTTAAAGTVSVSSSQGGAVSGNIFFEISKELNKTAPTPLPQISSLPQPKQPAPKKGLSQNWLGKIGDDQSSIIDSDNDGVSDELEDRIGTNPHDPHSTIKQGTTNLVARVRARDADFDGSTNDEEIANGTNPEVRDSDGDGCSDGAEVLSGANPSDKNDFLSKADDEDGDCLSNDVEINKTTNPKTFDTDGDGLSDADEIALGTDPFGKDTDFDGILDGREFVIGSDPLQKDY